MLALSDEIQAIVDDEVASGRYRSREEVLEAAVRMLLERNRKLDDLRADIQEGLDDLAAGNFVSLSGPEAKHAFFEDIKARGRRKLGIPDSAE